MNINDAIYADLDRHFRISPPKIAGVKSDPATPRGFTARLTALQGAYSDRKQQAAAIGISVGTLVRWTNGKQKPSKASAAKLDTAYQAHLQERRDRAVERQRKAAAAKTPASATASISVKVTATIRWSRSDRKQYNAQPHRTTTLTHINATPVLAAWAAGQDAGAALERATEDQYGVEEGGIGFEGGECAVHFHL